MPFTQTVNRLGILGDVHAEDQSLSAALDFFTQRGVTEIVCVGDVCTGQGSANFCCETLDKRKIPTVRGNHDRWFLTGDMTGLDFFTQRDEMSGRSELFLEGLPVTLQFETALGHCLLCHGLGQSDMAGVLPWDTEWDVLTNRDLREFQAEFTCPFVINGHTHRRMVRQIDGQLFINAGTLRRDHQPCLTIVDFQQRVVQFHDIENLTEIVDPDEIPFPG